MAPDLKICVSYLALRNNFVPETGLLIGKRVEILDWNRGY